MPDDVVLIFVVVPIGCTTIGFILALHTTQREANDLTDEITKLLNPTTLVSPAPKGLSKKARGAAPGFHACIVT